MLEASPTSPEAAIAELQSLLAEALEKADKWDRHRAKKSRQTAESHRRARARARVSRCRFCDDPIPYPGNGRPRVVCDICLDAGLMMRLQPLTDRPCDQCGSTFIVSGSQPQRFCSGECSRQARMADPEKTHGLRQAASRKANEVRWSRLQSIEDRRAATLPARIAKLAVDTSREQE